MATGLSFGYFGHGAGLVQGPRGGLMQAGGQLRLCLVFIRKCTPFSLYFSLLFNPLLA
jgi:hypothetical protein